MIALQENGHDSGYIVTTVAKTSGQGSNDIRFNIIIDLIVNKKTINLPADEFGRLLDC